MKKRIPALLLALLLCSCTSRGPLKTENTYEKVDPSIANTDNNDPDINYVNYEFTVLTAYATESKNISIFEDERNSDKINEEILLRNIAVEKKFNIKLKEYASLSPTSDIDNELLLNENKFDMIYAPASDISLLLSGGKLADLADFSAFDLEEKYYDGAALDALSVGNKAFALAGEYTLGTISATSVVLYNNRLLNRLNVKTELGKTLFEAVEDGEWTLDAMKRLSFLADTAGGDGEYKLFSGFLSSSDTAYSLAAGLGASIFAKDRNNMPTLNADTPGFADLFERIGAFAWYDGKLETKNLLGNCYDDEIKPTETLFTLSTLGEAAALSDTGLCLSVLPMPKETSDKDNYSCRVRLDLCELAAIPAATSDLSRSTAVLSELFALSDPVRDAYLSTLSTECIHDAGQMVEIVADSKKYDLGDLFGWGDFDLAVADSIVKDEPASALEEALGARSLAAEKALDILLKRLYGENYKEDIK